MILPLKQIYTISLNQCSNLMAAAQRLKTICGYVQLLGMSLFGASFDENGYENIITVTSVMKQLAGLLSRPMFNEEFVNPLLSTIKLFCDFINEQSAS